jgi:hypothetical protein
MRRLILTLAVMAVLTCGAAQVWAEQFVVAANTPTVAASVQPVRWYGNRGPVVYGGPAWRRPYVAAYPYTYAYPRTYAYPTYPYTYSYSYPYYYGYYGSPGGVYYNGPRVSLGFGW